MNVISLQHYNIKNQPASRNDVFSAFEAKVKGMTKMNHKRNLTDYAEELAYDYGKYDGESYNLPLSKLSDCDQRELARLYMEFTGRETSECIYGDDFSNDNNFTCALLNMLKHDNQDTRQAFAEVTRANIVTYYSEALQGVLDEACHDLLCNLQNEAGNHSYQDMDSGDISWGRC